MLPNQINGAGASALPAIATTLPFQKKYASEEQGYTPGSWYRTFEFGKERELLMVRYFPNLYNEDPHEGLKQATLLCNRLDELNQRFAVGKIEGQVCVLDLWTIFPPQEDLRNAVVRNAKVERILPVAMEFAAMEKLFRAEVVLTRRKKGAVPMSIASIWLEWSQRRSYTRGIIFAPGAPQSELPDGYLNIFTGWATPPTQYDPKADEAACSEYLHHLRYTVCGGDGYVYEWMLWWMADVVQNPQHKPGSALVLAGKKGCGKSTVAELMRDVIGEKYFAQLSKKDEIVGNFNGQHPHALIINGEEVMFGGDVAANEALKNMITASTINVNEKFLPRYQTRSYSRFIFTTNSHFSHNTDEAERRYLFLDVADTFLGDEEYWDKFYAQWENGGRQAFSNILFNMEKPANVDLRRPPKTKGHARLFAESLSVEERFFYNAMVDGENYPEEALDKDAVIFVSDVRATFHAYLDEQQGKARSSLKRSDNAFVPAMMEKYWSADPETKKRQMRGVHKEVCYVVPALQTAREIAAMSVRDGGSLGLLRETVGLEDEASD